MKPSHLISRSTSCQYKSRLHPKCISGSTSYLQVWLAFHPHPQVIQKLFNAYWFGPPDGVTHPSTCPRVDHLVSRLPLRLYALFRLAFASAADLKSQPRRKKLVGSLWQKARRHTRRCLTACRHMVSGTISLFCSKCFSPFLHSTGSLSVSREYLALPDGPGRFTQNSSCPRYSGYH